MRRPGKERDRDGAAKRADPVHAGEQADAGGAETQIVLADHRDHAGERPAEHVVDDGDRPGSRSAAGRAATSMKPFDHAFEDARDAGGPHAVAVVDPHRGGDRDEVAQRR